MASQPCLSQPARPTLDGKLKGQRCWRTRAAVKLLWGQVPGAGMQNFNLPFHLSGQYSGPVWPCHLTSLRGSGNPPIHVNVLHFKGWGLI